MNPRATAALMDRDKKTLERIGVPAAAKVGQTLSQQITAAYADRITPGQVSDMIRHYMNRMQPILLDGMVAGHLSGRARTIKLATAGMAANKKALGAYDDALKYFQKRMRLTSEDVEKLKKLYNQKSLEVVKTSTAVVQKYAQKAIEESIANGEHVKDAMARLNAALESAGVNYPSPFLIESLVKSNIGAAYSAGKWFALQDPAIQEEQAGFLYVTTGDNRVRDSHQSWDYFTGPKDHPFWQTHYPLCGWGCRCTAIATFTEAECNIPETYEAADFGDNPVTGMPWGTPPPPEMRDGLNEAA